MSVINTMLQDLEQRGGKHDVSREEILQGLSSSGTGMIRRGGLNPYLVSLSSVLVVCAILATAYLYSPYRLVAGQPDSRPLVGVAAGEASDGVENGRTSEQTAAVEERIAQPRQAVDKPPPAPQKQAVEPVAALPPAQDAGQTVAAPGGDQTRVEQANADATDRIETAGKHAAASAAPVRREHDNDAAISKTAREPGNIEKSVNAYAHALDLFGQGRTDESRLQLKQALGLDPSNSKASQLLAAIYLGDDRPALAADILDRSLKLRPADQDLLRLYLQVQVRMQNYAQAISIMEQRIHVNTPEDIAYLAGLHQKNNDHPGAVRLYAQALKLKPSNSVWWMGQGISFEALGMNEEAMTSYRQSIESGRLNTQLAEYVLGRIAGIEKSARDPVS